MRQPLAPGRQVDHGCDLAARLQDAGRHGEEQRPAARDQRPPPRQHILRLQQDGGARETHDPGQGPARKGHHTFLGTGCRDHCARGPEPRSLRSEGVDAEAGRDGPDRMVEHGIDRTGGQALAQRGSVSSFGRSWTRAEAAGRRPVHLASGGGRFVHEGDSQALRGGAESRLDPGGAGADDEEIGRRAQAIVPDRTTRPSRASIRHAGRRTPSTVTVHSWQIPIQQKAPRACAPRGLVRSVVTPQARSAAATDSPWQASIIWPSKVNCTRGPRLIPGARRAAGGRGVD